MAHDYDVLVIGSGFGGSVAALRLTEKGYRVGVLEAGRRFADHEYAQTSWRVRRFLWAPALRCFGILRITLLDDIAILSGAGVGGGSLVYANTLYRAPEAFYRDVQWAHITDWADELEPYYDQASRMLGVTTNPVTTPADEVLRDVAEQLGVGHTYRRTPVGVLFDAPDDAPPAGMDDATGPDDDPTGRGEDLDEAIARGGRAVPDPFFGGVGPDRRTCTHCGECMTGCRHGAKNTLVKNYLHLAERAGAEVHAMTTVRVVRPITPGDPSAGYAVETHPTGRTRAGRTLTAGQVVFAASALGTQRLLHRMRAEGHLPQLSERLGELSRTNSEALTGARGHSPTDRYHRGVAITSSIHPDAVTHIEPVRYGKGSNLMALITAVLVDPDDGRRARPAEALAAVRALGRRLPAALGPRRWSEQSIVLLTMQTLDNSVTTYLRPSRWHELTSRLTGRPATGGRRQRLASRQGIGEPNPTWIPVAHEATRAAAARMGGTALGSITALINRPMTAHFIGGCPIGTDPGTGVIDAYQRVFGYPGLHVLDGAAISANLGVNPSLTITAQAERACALWPNAGDADPRPALAQGYRRIAPVAPRRPVVPSHARGALRLPLVTGDGPQR